MEREGAAIDVTLNEEQKRLEARVGGRLAGIAEYIPAGQLYAFVHTEVEPEFEGRGVGSALAHAGLEMVRLLDARYLAVCPFVAGWAARHPEYDPWRHRPTSKVVD